MSLLVTWGKIDKMKHPVEGEISDIEGEGVRGKYAVSEYPKGNFEVIFWVRGGGDSGKLLKKFKSLNAGKRFVEKFDKNK